MCIIAIITSWSVEQNRWRTEGKRLVSGAHTNACKCCWESSSSPPSTHTTQQGAYESAVSQLSHCRSWRQTKGLTKIDQNNILMYHKRAYTCKKKKNNNMHMQNVSAGRFMNEVTATEMRSPADGCDFSSNARNNFRQKSSLTSAKSYYLWRQLGSTIYHTPFDSKFQRGGN